MHLCRQVLYVGRGSWDLFKDGLCQCISTIIDSEFNNKVIDWSLTYTCYKQVFGKSLAVVLLSAATCVSMLFIFIPEWSSLLLAWCSLCTGIHWHKIICLLTGHWKILNGISTSNSWIVVISKLLLGGALINTKNVGEAYGLNYADLSESSFKSPW